MYLTYSFVHQGAIGGTLPLVFYNHIAHNFPEVRFTLLSALLIFFVWWRKERVSFLFVFVKYQTPQPKPKKWWHRRYQTAALVAAYPLDKARLGKTCQKQWVKTKKTWQRQKTRIKDRKRRGIFAKTGHCVHLKTKDHKRIPLGYFKRKTILAFFVCLSHQQSSNVKRCTRRSRTPHWRTGSRPTRSWSTPQWRRPSKWDQTLNYSKSIYRGLK